MGSRVPLASAANAVDLAINDGIFLIEARQSLWLRPR